MKSSALTNLHVYSDGSFRVDQFGMPEGADVSISFGPCDTTLGALFEGGWRLYAHGLINRTNRRSSIFLHYPARKDQYSLCRISTESLLKISGNLSDHIKSGQMGAVCMARLQDPFSELARIYPPRPSQLAQPMIGNMTLGEFISAGVKS